MSVLNIKQENRFFFALQTYFVPSSVSLSKRPFGRWRHFTTTTTTKIHFVFSLIFKFGNPGEVLIAKALICTRKQNPEVVKPDKPVCPLMGPEAPCCSGGLCCLCLLIIHFILEFFTIRKSSLLKFSKILNNPPQSSKNSPKIIEPRTLNS